MKYIVFLAFFSFCAALIILPQRVKAESFDSNSYSIDAEVIPGAVTPTPEIPETNSQISASPSINYVVRSGYGEKTLPFRLKIGQDAVDFGPLSPTNPITRTTIISINSDHNYGYSLFIYENHPLGSAKDLIPDTTCDNGSCSTDIPAPWTSAFTYGFGYRCDDQQGTGCQIPLQEASEFLQIPKKPQGIMKNTVGGLEQSELTFKLNISSTQPASIYTNQITYIALPSL